MQQVDGKNGGGNGVKIGENGDSSGSGNGGDHKKSTSGKMGDEKSKRAHDDMIRSKAAPAQTKRR